MEVATTEKRKALRKMMQGPGCHIAPSCNDGIQARLVEWLGFPLVHISGSGQHRSLGFADAGLLTLTEMVNRAREIADAPSIRSQTTMAEHYRQAGIMMSAQPLIFDTDQARRVGLLVQQELPVVPPSIESAKMRGPRDVWPPH